MDGNYPKFYLYKRIVQAKLFIDARYNSGIDLERISDEACFSKFHFIRLFKSIYGCTPHQYLIKVRLSHAEEFLKNGASVTETCFAVGFESITSFITLFKRKHGITPSAFQFRSLQREEQIRAHPAAFIPNCFAAQHGWC